MKLAPQRFGRIWQMLVIPSILLFGLLRLAPAQPVNDEVLKTIQFNQKLGAQISLDGEFRDETGRPVALGDFFGKRPVILVLGYYGCPML